MPKEDLKGSKTGGKEKPNTSLEGKNEASIASLAEKPPKPKTDEAPRYPRETFADGKILKVQPHVIAGALHGSDKPNYTIDEVRKLVEIFLKRKVK